MEIVAIKRYFPGLLLKKGFLLRIIRTITDAEITDSRSHPDLNCVSSAFRITISPGTISSL
jgi:hypothetical protein